MAFVSSASRGNNPVKGRARSLFIPDRNYSLTKYLADSDGGSKRILPSKADCWSGISRICWNIDSQVLRADRRSPSARAWGQRQPPRRTRQQLPAAAEDRVPSG